MRLAILGALFMAYGDVTGIIRNKLFAKRTKVHGVTLEWQFVHPAWIFIGKS